MAEYSKNQSHVFLWIMIVLLIALFSYINLPFFYPILLAGIFALGLQDLVVKMTRRLGHRVLTITMTLIIGLGLLFIPLFLAAYRMGIYLSKPQEIERDQIVKQISVLKTFALNTVQKISDVSGLDLLTPAREMLDTGLHRVGESALAYSTDFITQLPAFAIASLTFFLLLMIMLLKSYKIRAMVISYSPLSKELTEKFIVISKDSCSITLFSTVVIGIIQAFVVGIGSLVFGEGDFWLVLAVTFVVSFIPVIGAAPVGYVLALLAYLGDRTGPAIGLAIVATFSGTIDNILKPFMVGKDNNVSAVLGFTCVVGAVIMLGLPGLLLGPVILNLVSQGLPLLLKDNQQKG
jgi:predicted PurR-regulated permease PerM